VSGPGATVEVNRNEGIAREQRLQLSEIRLNDLIKRAIDPWTLVAAHKRIVLEMVIPEELQTIRGDEDKLQRVFDNLLKNSIEAIEQGPGRVVVHVSLPASEKIRVSIADTGPGISEGTDVFCLFETTSRDKQPNATALSLRFTSSRRDLPSSPESRRFADIASAFPTEWRLRLQVPEK
jgi:signal transduction histidine kinase